MAFNKRDWRPNPKQELFLSLPTTIKEAILGGGAGTGKSDTLLIYPLVWKWHENPRFKQVFMRRTFPELRNEIVPRSRELYLKFGASFNKSDMAWTFPRLDQYGSGAKNNGAMIYLGHCEDETDVAKYDSMEINLFTPDELTSYTEYIYLYIGFTRVRTSDPTLPAIIRGAAMTGGVGHTFCKKRFVDPYKDAGLDPYSFPPKVIVGRGGNKRIYIHSTLVDNPHVDPGYAQSLDALPEAERKAKKFGDWDAYLGSVFDEFRDRKYPDEPENALHVIEPFNIPSWWPKIVIGDWGFAAMTWIGFAAISPHGRVYIYREMFWKKTKIEEWAPQVKYFIDKEEPKVIKFCKSAGQDRGQEHTIQQQISSALGRNIELTNNSPGSRIATKQLLHEYLRWKVRNIPENEKPVYNEELAFRIWRIRGEEAHREYMKQFSPMPVEDNLPKLQIFNNCPVLVSAIKMCSYDKPKNNKPAEDVAEFDGDDPYDGARYIVDAADKFFAESADEWKKVQKQQAIADELANNQDFTMFHRRMEKLEEGEPVVSVGRYRRH